MTEVVQALGAIDLVVGVDEYSAALPVFEHRQNPVPRVGDFLSPNLEAMLALHPDIALFDAVQEKFASQLKTAGIRAFAIKMQTLSDARQALGIVGAAIGREAEAQRVLTALDARLETETARARAAAGTQKKPRVLFVVDRRPGSLAGMVASGPGTYIDELVGRASAENVLADASALYVQISPEEVLRRAPDIILDALHDGTEKSLDDWKALATVPAVKNGRIYLLTSSIYVTPGPQLADALAGLVDKIWPK